MNKANLTLTTTLLFLSLIATSTHAAMNASNDGANQKRSKVSICHATHSMSNPYVLISVPAGVAFGHLIGEPHGPNGEWPDILPGSWGVGDAFYDDECQRIDAGELPPDEDIPFKTMSDQDVGDAMSWSSLKSRF